MRRLAFALLSSCLLTCLAVFSAPAKAGDYYDGYRRGDVWYTSSCCYRKVVRHVRIVRYVRVEPYYRGGYGYYDRPYLGPRPYAGYPYVAHPYVGYYDRPWRRIYRYGYYRARYAAYADGCYRRRIPWPDHRGGWVWAIAAYCD